MGNRVSDENRKNQADLNKFTIKDDAERYRVYIHRRNKIIHAWLVVTSDHIILEKSKSDVVSWPLQLIRRYGYTSAGVFFFESGRRCLTGEGLHCFQTQRADAIFQLVQQRIQDNVNNKKASQMKQNSQVQDENMRSYRPSTKPVQRFSSEGNGLLFDLPSQPSGYNSYHKGSQATHKLRKVMLPPPPRARSVGDDENLEQLLPKDSFHPHHPTRPERSIVGKIINESHNPSLIDDPFDKESRRNSVESMSSVRSAPVVRPSYVNLDRDLSYFPQIQASSSRTSVNSQPTSPTGTSFPLRWNCGAGSTNLICYTQPHCSSSGVQNSSTNGMESFQYVNTEKTLRPVVNLTTPTTKSNFVLNYADMANEERAPSRCSSESHTELGRNYTLIDGEKTKALKAAKPDDRGTLSSSKGPRKRLG